VESGREEVRGRRDQRMSEKSRANERGIEEVALSKDE